MKALEKIPREGEIHVADLALDLKANQEVLSTHVSLTTVSWLYFENLGMQELLTNSHIDQ